MPVAACHDAVCSVLDQPVFVTAAALLAALLVPLLGLPSRLLLRRRRAAARQRFVALRIATGEIRVQRHRLHLKRLQLVVPDHYGSFDERRWAREKRYFCNSRILPLLTARALAEQWPSIAADVDRRIERVAVRGRGTGFDPKMAPADYENYCARLLRRAGWQARVTKAGSDQGTDVLATRGRLSVVLQCKLYGRPVGNSAVQQIAAARAHHRANFAAVVSNADFTQNARELAATNQVYLLHHEELPDFLSHRKDLRTR